MSCGHRPQQIMCSLWLQFPCSIRVNIVYFDTGDILLISILNLHGAVVLFIKKYVQLKKENILLKCMTIWSKKIDNYSLLCSEL